MSEFPERARGEGIATTLAWFPAGEYDEAIGRWPSLADDWLGVPHDEYCRRFQRELLRLSRYGVPMRGVASIHLSEYLPWCDDEGFDPELPASRAHMPLSSRGEARSSRGPPGRNDPCWCGSGRKYKRCCATVSYGPEES
jgi:hypothetical protein